MVTPFSGSSSWSFTNPKTIPSFIGLGDTCGVGNGGNVGKGVTPGVGVVVRLFVVIEDSLHVDVPALICDESL